MGSSENITLAMTEPTQAPIICALMNASVSVLLNSPCARNESVTAGLKCAPEIEPQVKINATRAPPVAMAFSRSCRPTSLGERLVAMMPEPTTATISKAVPSPSASALRAIRSREFFEMDAGEWFKLHLSSNAAILVLRRSGRIHKASLEHESVPLVSVSGAPGDLEEGFDLGSDVGEDLFFGGEWRDGGFG